MFCRFLPPTAAPVVTQRPGPKLPMLNGGAQTMEVQVQWVSSFVPVLPTMGCGRHEPEAPAMNIASQRSLLGAANG